MSFKASGPIDVKSADAPQVSKEDEHALIRRVLSGERDEFRVLVERYQSLVFGVVMRQVYDRSVAEEIAQESFIRAYQHLNSFRFDSKFSTWLTRITINHLSNYFSSKAFRNSKVTGAIEIAPHQATSDQQSREKLFAVRRCIGLLPKDLQQIIILCGVEGQSYEEAAEILNTPIGTIRSRLNRARLELAAKMKKLEEEV